MPQHAGKDKPPGIARAAKQPLRQQAMPDFRIAPLSHTPEILAMLADLMVETVVHGGSVGFMHPLDQAVAAAFWDDSLARADTDDRIVFGAWHGQAIVGTVTLLLGLPPNQPHRAEIAKMMTQPAQRRRGIAAALLAAAEAFAIRRGRTLLVLDTASDGGASALYERAGFTCAGEIPDYALKPHGGLTATRLYWKRIGVSAVSG